MGHRRPPSDLSRRSRSSKAAAAAASSGRVEPHVAARARSRAARRRSGDAADALRAAKVCPARPLARRRAGLAPGLGEGLGESVVPRARRARPPAVGDHEATFEAAAGARNVRIWPSPTAPREERTTLREIERRCAKRRPSFGSEGRPLDERGPTRTPGRRRGGAGREGGQTLRSRTAATARRADVRSWGTDHSRAPV